MIGKSIGTIARDASETEVDKIPLEMFDLFPCI